MFRCIWYTFLFSLVLSPVLGMQVYVPPRQLIGSADLIVVATVTASGEIPDGPEYMKGQATLRIDKLLKGPAALKTVTVRYNTPPKSPPGMVIMDHGGIVLNVGQQLLFFLQRHQLAYTIVGGQQGMMSPEEAVKLAPLIDESPMTVTVISISSPLYFDTPVAITFTVKNVGRTPFQIGYTAIEGFFFSPQVDPAYVVMKRVDNLQDGGGRKVIALGQLAPPPTPDQATLNPGASSTYTMKFALDKPKGWQLFKPDTFLLTPVAVRAMVFVMPPQGTTPPAGTQRDPGFRFASLWVQTLAGFSPPPASEIPAAEVGVKL
ncbi:MAG: hypothetical protein ACYC7E_19445 [Armatimonadota bacterium]